MKRARIYLTAIGAALLSACGGSGGGSGGGTSFGNPTPSPTPAPTPSPTPTSAACSLSERQDFVLAALDEWYLFPTLLDTGVNKAAHNDLQDYVDALVAPARAQSRDRYFTYVTSIEEENAYYSSGSTAGLGFRLALDPTGRLFILETYENAPALGAGMDRGTEILAIGLNSNSLQNVSTIYASQGTNGLVNALGPDDVGVTRAFRIRDASGITREVTATKREYDIAPVSSRYGSRIFTDNGRKIGYLNLRTFISSANTELNSAFAEFKNQGVSELIIDLRYNGGGLISVAERMGDLMGEGRSGQIFNQINYRPDKSQWNEVTNFNPRAASIAPAKVAFITTGNSASASELVINSMLPYLGNNIAIVGSNSYGKPVGQIALDKPECDDRLRAVALRSVNRDGDGDYYTGLAGVVPNFCRAYDDIFEPLGNASEDSIKAALDYLGGRGCASSLATKSLAKRQVEHEPLRTQRPNAAQWDLPGIF